MESAPKTRLTLQSKLEELLGSRNVYYQPPETIKMQYDAIRYSLGSNDSRYANDKKYTSLKRYDLVVISRKPDPEVVDKILDLPYTSLGKTYVVDNLNHYPITLYD